MGLPLALMQRKHPASAGPLGRQGAEIALPLQPVTRGAQGEEGRAAARGKGLLGGQGAEEELRMLPCCLPCPLPRPRMETVSSVLACRSDHALPFYR